MSNYQPLSAVARRLNTSEADLAGFEQLRWIDGKHKDGNVFLSSRDEYKAKFILHLRSLNFTDDEIGEVLDTQQPPYSLALIPGILGERFADRIAEATAAAGPARR
jgi:hypothetical protein